MYIKDGSNSENYNSLNYYNISVEQITNHVLYSQPKSFITLSFMNSFVSRHIYYSQFRRIYGHLGNLRF